MLLVKLLSSTFGVNFSYIHVVKTFSSWYRQFLNQAQLLADMFRGLFW